MIRGFSRMETEMPAAGIRVVHQVPAVWISDPRIIIFHTLGVRLSWIHLDCGGSRACALSSVRIGHNERGKIISRSIVSVGNVRRLLRNRSGIVPEIELVAWNRISIGIERLRSVEAYGQRRGALMRRGIENRCRRLVHAASCIANERVAAVIGDIRSCPLRFRARIRLGQKCSYVQSSQTLTCLNIFSVGIR